jgi:hypothetical protein
MLVTYNFTHSKNQCKKVKNSIFYTVSVLELFGALNFSVSVTYYFFFSKLASVSSQLHDGFSHRTKLSE